MDGSDFEAADTFSVGFWPFFSGQCVDSVGRAWMVICSRLDVGLHE